MKIMRILALTTMCALLSIEFIQAKTIVSKKTQRRHAAAKKAAEQRAATQTSLKGLSGQPLIDALHARNMVLAADIKKHQDNIKGINKARGKHSVLVHGKSKLRLNARTPEQKAALKANHEQISLATREINNNQIQIASAQKAVNQLAAINSQNALIAALKSNNGQISPALQTALNTATKAAYNQGQADQLATDSLAIQNAYNQGYSDGQNGIDMPSITAPSSATLQSAPATSSVETVNQSAAPTLICEDQSIPNAQGLCADGSDAIDISIDLSASECADGSTPDANGMCADGSILGDTGYSDYVSSCDDGSISSCADGTDITTAPCTDQSSPDINGMCQDGNFVNCTDGTQPACADGMQAY